MLTNIFSNKRLQKEKILLLFKPATILDALSLNKFKKINPYSLTKTQQIVEVVKVFWPRQLLFRTHPRPVQTAAPIKVQGVPEYQYPLCF